MPDSYMYKFKDKFFHWLNYQPPGALNAKGWRLFRKEFRENAPIRYWLTHTLRYKYTLPFKRRAGLVWDFIRYRTFDRYDVLYTGLPPGYYEIDNIMLHVNFNLLKDFLECELAWVHYYSDPKSKQNKSWFEKYLPFYRRFRPFRSQEWAMNALNWAAKLDDPTLHPFEQDAERAEFAREARELYLWWTNTVPNRKYHELKNYSDQGFDMSSLDPDFDETASDYIEYKINSELNNKLREEWALEDDQMLLRLMKIRTFLWT